MNDLKIQGIIEKISAILEKKDTALIAIDGRCASGKTTLAAKLFENMDCNVFHMDDFFLRPEQRTAARLAEAGGNVDRERFEKEVLLPLTKGISFAYRPYDCGNARLGTPITVMPKKLNIIEGSYSCHPSLFSYFDLHIFVTMDSEEQMRRIFARNGREKAEIFRTRWIPMEERYFDAFDIKNQCKIVIDTSKR